VNQTLEVIKSRRSTRRFKSEQIDNEILEEIIEAGMYAPSAHGAQGWHFTVIQDPDLLEELNIEIKESAKSSPIEVVRKMVSNESFNVFYKAPTVVLISGETSALMPKTGCLLASQNILLAAESLGVAGCWNEFVSNLFIGGNAEKFKAKLNVPEGYTPYHGIVLGISDKNPSKVNDRKDNKVTYLR